MTELPKAKVATDMHIDGKGHAAYTAEQMNEFAGQYTIQVLERKIESLTAALEGAKSANFTSDYMLACQQGQVSGLSIAIDALRLEIPFVKLERGPLIINNKE